MLKNCITQIKSSFFISWWRLVVRFTNEDLWSVYALTGGAGAGAGDAGGVTAGRRGVGPRGVPLSVPLYPQFAVGTDTRPFFTAIQIAEGDPGVQDVIERDLCRRWRDGERYYDWNYNACPNNSCVSVMIVPVPPPSSIPPLIHLTLSTLTDLDGEARRQAQSDEVPQFGKQGVGDRHEIDDRHHLFSQRQRMGLTQPQLCFKPGKRKQTSAHTFSEDDDLC